LRVFLYSSAEIFFLFSFLFSSGFHKFNDVEFSRAHIKFVEAKKKGEASLALQVLPKETDLAEYKHFKAAVGALADRVDKRIYILGSSFFVTGLSIGIIIPILPILVKHLQLSPTEFSVVVR
jgi:hypothetical protein